MKLLRNFLLVCFVFGVSSTYGAEKSCNEHILEITPQLKESFDALKVYKRGEDKTEFYRKLREKNSNKNIAELEKMLRGTVLALRLNSSMSRLAKLTHFAMADLMVSDLKDKSSEVVLLCVGRMRLQDGTHHFMMSVTKDEEGDRFWRAWPIS